MAGIPGGTYGANAVACAADVGTFDVIRDEGLVENSAQRGSELKEALPLSPKNTRRSPTCAGSG